MWSGSVSVTYTCVIGEWCGVGGGGWRVGAERSENNVTIESTQSLHYIESTES